MEATTLRSQAVNFPYQLVSIENKEMHLETWMVSLTVAGRVKEKHEPPSVQDRTGFLPSVQLGAPRPTPRQAEDSNWGQGTQSQRLGQREGGQESRTQPPLGDMTKGGAEDSADRTSP